MSAVQSWYNGIEPFFSAGLVVLNQMVAYRGGLSAATDLIETWRQTYPRRTAMLDELRRFDGSPS